jgi:hypothetical protein
MKTLNSPALLSLLIALATGAPLGAAQLNKTIRVDHGRPVVVVSDRSVLLLEFLHEPTNGIVAHDDPAITHYRAAYRWQVLDGTTGSVTNGGGTVEEILRTVFANATRREVKDVGSRTGISAGEFGLSWSVGSAGVRSWLYYRANSNIRFIQQPRNLAFDAVDEGLLRRYLSSRNVQQFVAAGKTVQVIGPAVFAGDWPIEQTNSGRIASCRVTDHAVQLKFMQLQSGKPYVIDSSYEAGGNWSAVHSFRPADASYEWTDPLGKDVTTAFYRVRQAPY